jgi:hypothetical protein
VPFNADPACFGPYTKVPDDPALRTSAGQNADPKADNYDPAAPSGWRIDDAAHGAFKTGAVAVVDFDSKLPRWYRLPPGHGLATAPPDPLHCGTRYTGWLSGWRGAAGTAPDDKYYDPTIRAYTYTSDSPADGRLPPAAGLPPADGVVCFDGDFGSCQKWLPVRAVGCGAFDLWSLLSIPTWWSNGLYRSAYCLAA